MAEGKISQIYLPLEPHIWLRDAIEAKAKKVPEYLVRCNAYEAWLIIHSARGVFSHAFSHLSRLFNSDLVDLFHIGVWSYPHPFKRIYLTSEYDLAPVCIYRAEHEASLRNKYERLKVICIPIERRSFARVVATAAPNGEGQITINFNQRFERNILLQPLDSWFRADYSKIATVDNALVAQETLPAIIYAQPIESAESNDV